MKDATVKNMRDAFSSESMAQVRYLIFAGNALEEGFPGTSRLFRSFSMSKYIRASEHYRLARTLLGEYRVCTTSYFILERTMDNLTRAKEAERSAWSDTYDAYLAVAEQQGEDGAVKSFRRSARICKAMADILSSVQESIVKGAEEPETGIIYICQECGNVEPGDQPVQCPVCGGTADDYLPVD